MVAVSYLVYYNTLLQNAADIITKSDSYFITKCDKSLLRNTSCPLLQNMMVLLQNATILLQNETVIAKSDFYYKMRWYRVVSVLFRK